MSSLDAHPDGGGNPFSTRHVRPGAVEYYFSPGENLTDVLQRLKDNDWQGQIIGPHGSGKSTLLAALLPAVEALGHQVVLIELHDGQRRLPEDIMRMVRACTHHTGEMIASILVIDGYEQLPWWRRRWLQWHCRRRGIGLLVTAHRSVGLADIFQTHVAPDIAQQVVSQLLDDWPQVITTDEIRECINSHDQDFREALFELYDLFEHRRQQEP